MKLSVAFHSNLCSIFPLCCLLGLRHNKWPRVLHVPEIWVYKLGSYLAQLWTHSKSSHMRLLSEWMPALLHTILPVPGMADTFTTSLQVSESHFLCEVFPGFSPYALLLWETHSSVLPQQYTFLLVFISRCHLKLLTYFRYFTRHVSLMAEAYSSTGPQDERLADAWWVHSPFIKQYNLVHGVGAEINIWSNFFLWFLFSCPFPFDNGLGKFLTFKSLLAITCAVLLTPQLDLNLFPSYRLPGLALGPWQLWGRGDMVHLWASPLPSFTLQGLILPVCVICREEGFFI